MRLLAVWLMVLVVVAGQARGQEVPQLPIPTNIERTDFYLLTAGLGAGVEARYGHTILRIVDHESGRENNLNWGMFSFDEPNFALKFFLGQLWYWMASESYANVLVRYQRWEKRPLFSNKLNLTKTQKLRVIEEINRFLRENGRKYLYHYFYNNCSTIPRDILNAALNDRLRARYAGQASGVDFRYYVYTYLNAPPPVAFFLDIVMNSNIDFIIDRWQEMFYPLKLQEYLLALQQEEGEGPIAAGTPLLGPTERLNTHEDVPSALWHIYPWWLLVSLGLMVPLTLQRLRGQRNSKLAQRLFGVYVCWWGLSAGLLGLVMTLSWVFSGHLDLHHNANLWLFWPIDFALVLVGIRIFRGKALWRWVSPLALLHIGALAAVSILSAAGLIEQNISRPLLYMGPGLVLASLHLFRPFS